MRYARAAEVGCGDKVHVAMLPTTCEDSAHMEVVDLVRVEQPMQPCVWVPYIIDHDADGDGEGNDPGYHEGELLMPGCFKVAKLHLPSFHWCSTETANTYKEQAAARALPGHVIQVARREHPNLQKEIVFCDRAVVPASRIRPFPGTCQGGSRCGRPPPALF